MTHTKICKIKVFALLIAFCFSCDSIDAQNNNKLKDTFNQVLKQAPREVPFPVIPGASFESGVLAKESQGSIQYLRYRTPYDRNQLIQWYRSAMQTSWTLTNPQQYSKYSYGFSASNEEYNLSFTFLDHTNGTNAADVAVVINTRKN